MIGKAYEDAMRIQGEVMRQFALRQHVILDGRIPATVVGKTVETVPVYDLRVEGSRETVLYVPSSRLAATETYNGGAN